MSLVARLRNASRKQLGTLLLLLLAANLGTAAYVVAYVPIMRLYPMCHDKDAASIFGPSVPVKGEMAPFFFFDFDLLLSGRRHWADGRQIYVTLGGWLDHDWKTALSHQATRNLLAQRHRVDPATIENQSLGLPEFDEVNRSEWPPCGAMKKLALEGGEWQNIGPEPDLDIAIRRLERLSRTMERRRPVGIDQPRHAENP